MQTSICNILRTGCFHLFLRDKSNNVFGGHIGVLFKIIYLKFFCSGTPTWGPRRQMKRLCRLNTEKKAFMSYIFLLND